MDQAPETKDPMQCPRCGCFHRGPKSQDGCSHCGHLNARNEEDRFASALEQIREITSSFWGIQEDGDLRPALEHVGMIVLRTLARPAEVRGTYKGVQLVWTEEEGA